MIGGNRSGAMLQVQISHKTFRNIGLIGRPDKSSVVETLCLIHDHLLSLGACTLSRKAYLNSLQDVVKQSAIDWKKYQEGVFSSKTIVQKARLLE